MIKVIIIFCFTFFLLQENGYSSNLDGTSSIIYKNQHHVFSNGEYAQGYVRMGGGFTIKPDAKAILDMIISVSGSIDLRTTGTLELINDLELDSNLSLSSGGYIRGRGKALILNSDFHIPTSSTIRIISDTIIDGHNKHALILDSNAQISIENNATLTLKNLILKNTKNDPYVPWVQIDWFGGKLALDNVIILMANDFYFEHGQLFIHNDVIFSGTSAFIYTSNQQSFIAPSSKLHFDIGTTFSLTPLTSIQEMLILQDKTAQLSFNGSSLKTTASGTQLTQGTLLLNNKVTLDSQSDSKLKLTLLDSEALGSNASYLDWDPTGTVLASSGSGNIVGIYDTTGLTLTLTASRDVGHGINDLKWRPNGSYLAVVGSSYPHLIVYHYYQSTLATATVANMRGFTVSGQNTVQAVAWNHAGDRVIVGGLRLDTYDDIAVYSFNGSSLSRLSSLDYDTNVSSRVTGMDLHPTKNYLAVCGNPISTGNPLRIYRIDASSLTQIATASPATYTHGVSWHPSGKYVAVGQSVFGGYVYVYKFDGSSLTLVTSKQYTSNGGVYATAWDHYGRYLAITGLQPEAVGGFSNSDDLRIYRFTGTELIAEDSADFTTLGGHLIYGLAWNNIYKPLVALGGANNSGTELRLYDTNIIKATVSQALTRSIIFGNSALGSDYDLNVEILGNAHTKLRGNVVDDSA